MIQTRKQKQAITGSMSSLNKGLFEPPDTHVSVFYFSIQLSLRFITPPHGESVHVSYMTDKFSCSICKVKKLPWVIFVSCSLFKDLTLCLIYILIPSLSYLLLLMSPFLYLVPSHSCDPLEDLFPSLSQYGSASVLFDNEDLEFWRSYLRIHFHFCEFLCFSCQLSPIGWQSVESYPCLTSITSIHMAWIVLVLWDFWRRP